MLVCVVCLLLFSQTGFLWLSHLEVTTSCQHYVWTEDVEFGGERQAQNHEVCRRKTPLMKIMTDE